MRLVVVVVFLGRLASLAKKDAHDTWEGGVVGGLWHTSCTALNKHSNTSKICTHARDGTVQNAWQGSSHCTAAVSQCVCACMRVYKEDG